MRHSRTITARSLLALSPLLPALATPLVGCGHTATYVHAETTTLGRVVVYRNGVAYFERSADLTDDTLRLSVPADKVDDFLKSLTVVDAKTGKPAPIAYPTALPSGAGDSPTEMKIQLLGAAPHHVKLTYVSESPSWKPSYRIVLGKDGQVDLKAWAIIDNTSGEDWNRVALGVGSSSALSFRFDLRSVRVVERETLRSDDLFALAPPMGGASYGHGVNAQAARILGELSDGVLAADDPAPPPATKAIAHAAARAPSKQSSANLGGASSPWAAAAPSPVAPSPVVRMARSLLGSDRPVIVEGFSDAKDTDKRAASLERANKVREELVRNGIAPDRIVAVGQGEQAGRSGGVRIVEGPAAPPAESRSDKEQGAAAATETPSEPIGTSHFESTTPMTVPRATSAMVSILDATTEGQVVYLYDPESPRGNGGFPFKALRVKNPTDSVLESGPVTVFGEGRFVGEGLSEPIPARSVAFIPFAQDRQIVVEKTDGDRDEIARILTVQRGVFSTEVRHIRRYKLKLTSRMEGRAIVYVRHTVASGFHLLTSSKDEERLGNAHLFRVELEPNESSELTIEEATPVYRTTDIRSPEGLEMVRVYLSSTAAGPLKDAVESLLKVQRDMSTAEQRIATVREQMQEYRARMDELHVQIVTLRAVRTGGPLMHDLEKKLQDMSDRLSRATLEVTGWEEKLMVSRIHFQDAVADLSLEEKKPPTLAPVASSRP